MPEKKRRYFLREKESRAVLKRVLGKLRIDVESMFEGKVNLEIFEAESTSIFLIDGKPLLAETEQNLFPTLVFDKFLETAPKVVVDMGAVPYVCKGANVMAPGVRLVDGEFKKGDLVAVIDERHHKALAIGEALFDSEETRRVKQGAVTKTVHFVGDRTWNLMKTLETKV